MCFSTPAGLWKAYVATLVACFTTPAYTIYMMGGLMRKLKGLSAKQGGEEDKLAKSLVAQFGRLHLPRALWLSAAFGFLTYSIVSSS